MGYVVGDSSVSTWARLRSGVRQFGGYNQYSHNVIYQPASDCFKSLEGNGLIASGLDGGLFYLPPSATVNDYAPGIFAFRYLDVRYEAVFTGQSATTNLGETFTIDATAFAAPYQTTVPVVIGNDLDVIGLLDPIT